jgi:3-isopropylmalate/(R)-2-methylmalate dehydratase large subunit
MGQTIVEKILNHSVGESGLSAGEIVDAKASFLMTNDAVGELTLAAFAAAGAEPWDKKRIAIVLDHYIPASTVHAARVHKILRDFCRKSGVHFFDQEGVCHQLMIENFVQPGDVIIGTDSHACTYGGLGAFATGVGSTDGAAVMATGKIWLKIPESIRIELRGALPSHVHPKDLMLKIIKQLGADGASYMALEFTGEGTAAISNAGRLTLCNMAVEAGAKTGIFEPDGITESFYHGRSMTGTWFHSDADARYAATLSVDLDQLAPQIACPWSVDNVVPVDEVAGMHIDQAFIGSCTNGRIEDLQAAAKVLYGNKVHPNVRLLITPASRSVYKQALAEGLIEIFLQSGAVLCNPGCSACFGGQGMLWENEVCIGTHNRNFKGRMGHAEAKVLLASPDTTAASAVAGFVADPRTWKGNVQ